MLDSNLIQFALSLYVLDTTGERIFTPPYMRNWPVLRMGGNLLHGLFGPDPKYIREACGKFYDSEKQAHVAEFSLGRGLGAFVVTDSTLDGKILTISYDFLLGF